MYLRITNGLIFTNDEAVGLLQDHAIIISENRIAAVLPTEQARNNYPDVQELDAHGGLIMPGWINAHTHFYSVFARGIPLNRSSRGFKEILENLWWRLDRALDAEGVYYSALNGALSAIRHGVTTVIDHHASPNCIEGSLDQIARALSQTGLRATLCYEVSDRNGHDEALAGLTENRRFITACRQQRKAHPNALLTGMVGLHASFTLHDETLAAAADLGESLQTGCHIHLSEDRIDQWHIENKVSSAERLVRAGILGERSLAAHGVHLNEHDLDLLTENGVSLVHNPTSNMNNAVGRADVLAMLKKGITVGLGSDGMSQSLLPEIQAAFLMMKHGTADPAAGWQESRQMTLQNNRLLFEKISGLKTGVIQVGAAADVVIYDYQTPTPLNEDNIWAHILYGFADARPRTVLINGEPVLQNGRFNHLDEEQIYRKARESALATWKRMENIA